MNDPAPPFLDDLLLPAQQPRYAALGWPYHVPVAATPLPEPRLVLFNEALAGELGLPPTAGERLLPTLAGNAPWPGYQSLASVYAGHQFGQFVPQLGDGRALLIAELADRHGQRQELQLKGAGQTPFSRGADGRAVLRSSIREYLCSEAMHALGVPTTRCLSLVASPQLIQREHAEPAAVVCRVSPSFVRFGSFEFFYYRGRHELLAPLADHVIYEHFPHLEDIGDHHQRYALWLTEVVERTARLIAQWQCLGFCHGVMNTDNFSILGLTIDYGPFGFMDTFRRHHICNHSDFDGRYAYGAQPDIGLWNCSRLLQATLPLLAEAPEEAEAIATAIYQRYAEVYSTAAQAGWRRKFDLPESADEASVAADQALMTRFLDLLQKGRGDFTRSFRHLAAVGSNDAPAAPLRDELLDLAGIDAWVADYRMRLHALGNTDDAARAARLRTVNPKYVLRNHLAQIAIERAEAGDHSELHRLAALLARPFDEHPAHEAYAEAPPEHLRHIEVSCSS